MPPPPGDKPASYDTREPRPTRPVSRNRPIGVINLPASMRAGYDSREIGSKTAPLGVINLPQSIRSRSAIRAMHDPEPPLSVIQLPATTHASYYAHASYDTRQLRFKPRRLREGPRFKRRRRHFLSEIEDRVSRLALSCALRRRLGSVGRASGTSCSRRAQKAPGSNPGGATFRPKSRIAYGE